MTAQETATSVPLVGQMHVYLLPTEDNTRLKIGRSLNPLDRIAGLATQYPEIDLGRSVIVAVDSPRIESVLHTVFGKLRQAPQTRKDGCTEWFAGDITEEVLALLAVIALRRDTEYPVFHGVDALMRHHLARNPNAGQRAPRLTKRERLARVPVIQASLREVITEQTHRFLDVLWERPFDNIVRFEGYSYLARGVWRGEEPECWHPDRGARGSEWGQRLAEMGRISARVDGGSAMFGLIRYPIFSAIGEHEGREYFQICKATSLQSDSTRVRELPDAVAFAFLREAISDLPVIEADRDSLACLQSSQRKSQEPR